MRKLPYERFVIYLLLARNKYSSIKKYLASYRMANLDGREMRSFERQFKKLATPEELGFLDTNFLRGKLDDTKNAIDIKLFIPKELTHIQNELDLKADPFDSSIVKIIFENILLRRTVEVYLTTMMEFAEICVLVNDRFRLKLSPDDIDLYKYWFYNLDKMLPDDIEAYFEDLPMEEQNYKRMAYSDKKDYVRWKMQNDCNIDKDVAVKNIMADAFFNFKETINSETISHNAAKIWSDIFFKALDYVSKDDNGSDANDIFGEIKFNLVKEDTRSVIPFSELVDTEDE